jgi:hypothetical protein
VKLNRPDEAHDHLCVALEQLLPILGRQHWRIAVLIGDLGQCEAALGDLDNGIPHLEAAYADLARRGGPGRPYAREIAHCLQNVFAGRGDLTRLALWQDREAALDSVPPSASHRPAGARMAR